MKKLFVARHAKSDWDAPLLSDHDRPLNDRGKRDAPLMGKHFKSEGIKPGLFISSTANRALTTAKLMAEQVGVSTDEIHQIAGLYHASGLRILEEARSIAPDIESAIIFCHNPGITYFVIDFFKETIGNMPTCGIAEIHFDVNTWQEVDFKNGVGVKLYFPKRLW